MNSTRHSFWSHIATATVAGLLVSGCGLLDPKKDSGNDNNNAAPKPTTSTATATTTAPQTAVPPAGAPAQGTGGQVSNDPNAQGTGTGVAVTPPQNDLQTLILNQTEVGTVYNKPTLILYFGVKGTLAGNTDAITYECKRDGDSDFKTCGTDGSNKLDLGTLTDGQTVNLEVRAVVKVASITAASTKISFKVQLPATGGTPGTGAPGGVPGTGAPGGVPGTGAPGGVPGTGAPGGVPGTGAPGGAVPAPTKQVFLVGQDFEFQVPAHMHVTEYTTRLNGPDGVLNYFQISSKSDPYYVGNNSCGGVVDLVTQTPSPSGIKYQYCNMTPPGDIFTWMTERRIAENHIEVVTDHDLIDAGTVAYDNISINYFNTNAYHGFNLDRSRFARLCQNGHSMTQVLDHVPLATGFFNEVLVGNVFTCVANLTIASNAQGLPFTEGGETYSTWVGGAFITIKDGMMPIGGCFNIPGPGGVIAGCPSVYGNNMLEITFVSKERHNTAEWFTRQAIENLVGNLRAINLIH